MRLRMDLCPCFGSKKGKKPKCQEDGDFGKKSNLSGNAPANTFPVFEQVVAVKQLNKAGHQGDHEFIMEVLMLSLLRHPHLVSLIGYCAEGEQRLLVYEYLSLKSLDDLLHGKNVREDTLTSSIHRIIRYLKGDKTRFLFKKLNLILVAGGLNDEDLPPDREPLDWNTRMMIAAGVARGLNYLHNEADPSVIHRDLKSSNILLDEKYQPKLSDFGLAKFGPTGDKTHVSTRVLGTQGYCAPEYGLSGKLTKKSDIYSFGVVLLEIITGRRALEYVDGHTNYIVEWTRPIIRDRENCAELADPMLGGQFPESSLRKVLDLAAMCIREEPNKRPPIDEVVLVLDYLASQKYHPHASAKVSPKKVHGDKSPSETSTAQDKELEREQAIAEAKMWGESWRDKRRHISLSNTDVLSR